MHVHPFCGLHEISFPKVGTFGLFKPWGGFRWFAMFFFGGEDQVIGLPSSTPSKNKIQGYKLQFLVIEVCFQVLNWELFEDFLEAIRHFWGESRKCQ